MIADRQQRAPSNVMWQVRKFLKKLDIRMLPEIERCWLMDGTVTDGEIILCWGAAEAIKRAKNDVIKDELSHTRHVDQVTSPAGQGDRSEK